MKRAILLTLIVFFKSAFCFGQNLVPNPSFEEYDTCPQFLSQISYANGWFASRQTPDYYNSCATLSTTTGVPKNYFGNMYPASGEAYAGFMARVPEDTTWTETIAATLIAPLVIGQRYFVSFKVALAVCDNPSLQNSYCGVSKIGALFSTFHYTLNNPIPRCLIDCAQVQSNAVISDTSSWVIIMGSFIADFPFEYINIGRFNYNYDTDTIQLAGVTCNAYYFVDDVCVSTDSLTCYLSTSVPAITNNGLKIYPNPASDFLKIDMDEVCDCIRIYDNLGRLVFERYKPDTGLEVDVSGFKPGVYMVESRRKDFLSTQKIVILR